MKFTGERLVTDLPPMWGVTEHLHRYALAMELCAGKKVLDIASGEGYGSNLLASVASHVYGVDISDEAISHSSLKYKKANLSFHLGSTDRIPLLDSSVDVVISFETLEHHDKHDEMFSEFKRVLKSDGLVFLSSPERSIYSQRDPNNPYHIKELVLQEFKNLVYGHFKFACFYQQRAMVATIVNAEVAAGADFKLYDGDFTKIRAALAELPDHGFLNLPFFNLVLCSNNELATRCLPQVSCFNASKIYDSAFSQIEASRAAIFNSRTHRVGRLVLLPYRAVNTIFRRVKDVLFPPNTKA